MLSAPAVIAMRSPESTSWRMRAGATLAAFLAFGGCSASDRDLTGAHDGGEAEGADSGDAAVNADASPCGPLMVLSGSICVDKQPALHADGSQGSAVSFTEAVTICEARGARLCTEAEREAACPDGQVSLDTPANGSYCGGPASTWEWSGGKCIDGASCRSPCCNTKVFACGTNACADYAEWESSFRCCRSL